MALVSIAVPADAPDPRVFVIMATSLCPTSHSILRPRDRSVFSNESMRCLVGPYGDSGNPRMMKNSSSDCGSTIGGIQFANLLLIRSKRCLKVSKVSPSFIFSVNKEENSANSARVVVCMLSSRIVCRSGIPAPYGTALA